MQGRCCKRACAFPTHTLQPSGIVNLPGGSGRDAAPPAPAHDKEYVWASPDESIRIPFTRDWKQLLQVGGWEASMHACA